MFICKFILLLNHSDWVLTNYLQKMAEKGWLFTKNDGNWFFFKKKNYDGCRISVVTYPANVPEMKMEYELYDYTSLIKKTGWDVINIGKPETILDSRRHVFLKTTNQEAKEPDHDPDICEKTEKRGKLSKIKCFVLFLLLSVIGFLFIKHNFPDIVTSNSLIIITSVEIFLFAAGIIFSVGSLINRENKKLPDKLEKRFLWNDHAVLICSIMILIIIANYLIDSFINQKHGERRLIGDETVELFSDKIPLTLKDIDQSISGNLESSRYSASHSLIASQIHGFDEKLNEKDLKNFKLISYTIYKSTCPWILNKIFQCIVANNFKKNYKLVENWNASEVWTNQDQTIVRYKEEILNLKSNIDFNQKEINLAIEKLNLMK